MFKKPVLLLVIGIFVCLTLAFYFDFHIAGNEEFDDFILKNNSEPKVYGRLAYSMNEGMFSSGALLGFCYRGELPNLNLDTSPFNNMGQMTDFYENQTCPGFYPYKSHPGFQGMFFHFVGKIHRSPELFRMITAAILALAVTLWLAWLSIYFGNMVVVLTFFSLFLLRWFIDFGDNIGLFLGAMYMPMVILFWAIEKGRIRKLGMVAFVTMLISILFSGAEFIFSRIVMTFMPIVFYAIQQKWQHRKTIKLGLKISIGIFLACFVSMGILLIQISAVDSFKGGIDHLKYSIGKRTYGNVDNYNLVYKPGLKEPLYNVLIEYFDITAISSAGMNLNFKQLTIFFMIISFIGIIIQHKSKDKNLKALLITTWVSILGPLSWIIISKAHSHSHKFMDPIVWYMPFVLFGMVLTATVLKKIMENGINVLVNRFKSNKKSRKK